MELRPHALFILVRGFVTDSFLYPVASIFRMAWFAARRPAPLVDERALSEAVLAHIPLPLGGLTAFIRLTRPGPV